MVKSAWFWIHFIPTILTPNFFYFHVQNELDLVKILCNPEYEPHKKNKNIAKTAQTFASWAVDIWEKKSKSYDYM